jgi:hypothetical protein
VLWSLGNLGIYFPGFCILYYEKSGNSESKKKVVAHQKKKEKPWKRGIQNSGNGQKSLCTTIHLQTFLQNLFLFIKLETGIALISPFQHTNNSYLVSNAEQHCNAFPKNVIPWRDSNLGLLFLRRMQSPLLYAAREQFLNVGWHNLCLSIPRVQT